MAQEEVGGKAAGAGSSVGLAGGALAGLAVGVLIWLFAIGPKGGGGPVPAEAPDAGAPASPAALAPLAALPEPATQPAATAAAPAPAVPAPAAAPEVTAAPDATAPEATAPAPAAASEAPSTGALPSFDTVRAEPDGSVIVAGQATPGAQVVISINGAEVARATADAKGAFAGFLSLAPGAVPNIVTLSMLDAAGQTVGSEQTVILAPVVATQPPAQPPAQAAAADTGVAEAAPAEDGAAQEQATASPAPVAEPVAPADPLVSDAEGVRKLMPAPTETVVIDTIAYGMDGGVDLAGRARPGAGAFVRAYLNNAEAGTAAVAGDGRWDLRLTGIAPGLYTLRVDQLDAAGKVVSRTETPFLRETPDAVAAAQAQAGVAAPGADTPTPEPQAAAAPVQPAAEPTAEAAASTATEPVAAAPATPAPAEPVAAPATAVQAGIITVQPGFTLWGIARESYGDGFLYVKVFEANSDQIRDPDLIYPGQVFAIPAPEE